MLVQLTTIKSLEYSGTSKTEINNASLLGGEADLLSSAPSTSTKKMYEYIIDFSGSADLQDKNNLKYRMSFKVSTDELPMTLGMEVRMIDKISYFSLTDAPNIGLFDLSTLKDQWLKVDMEAIAKQFGFSAKKNTDFTPEELEAVKTALQQTKLFKIIKVLADEKIEGVDSYHYQVAIDKEAIKRLFPLIVPLILEKPLTTEEMSTFAKNFDEVVLPDIEIWIGKKDFLPHQLALSSLTDTKMETAKTKIYSIGNLVILFKNYNQPVQIEIPQKTQSLEEIFGGLIGGLSGPATSTISDPSISQPSLIKDSDHDGLTDEMEKIYGTNPNKADTDGDGFTDTEEITKGYNPNGPGKLAQ